MKRVFLGLALIAVATVVVTNVSFGQEGEEQDAMKAYMEAIAPNAHHEAFNHRVGEFAAVVKVWPAPGVEPVSSEGKSTYQLVLGGRFLTQQMEGQVMGMPFVGMGVNGFDKVKGKHTAYWVDSMGTQAVYSEGDCSDHCMKEWYTFNIADPMSGEERKVKMVTVIKSKDEHVFEWYQPGPDGEMYKSMEIAYTRVSG
jgi:hypothetical protein